MKAKPLYFALSTCFTLLNIFNVCNGLSAENAVRNFFEYFRAENPTGIPVLELGEPYSLYSPLGTVPIDVIGGKVNGHSNITVKELFVDFMSLIGTAQVTAPRITVYGDFIWPSLFYQSEGLLQTTMYNVSSTLNFTMFIDDKDELILTDVQIDQEHEDRSFNLSGSLLWQHKKIVSSGAIDFFFHPMILEIFRQMKPTIIDEANTGLRKFISTLPPFESILTIDGEDSSPKESNASKSFAVLLNRLTRFAGLEPLHLPDREYNFIGIDIKVQNMMISGVSSVSTMNSFFIVYEQKKIFIETNMRFPELMLFYTLKFAGGSFMKFGTFEKIQLNDVDVKIRLTVDPSAKNPPIIKYFDLYLGSYGKVREKRRGLWGRMVNFVKGLDDRVMREVVNALQSPIRRSLQKELNNVDIEEALINMLEKRSKS